MHSHVVSWCMNNCIVNTYIQRGLAQIISKIHISTWQMYKRQWSIVEFSNENTLIRIIFSFTYQSFLFIHIKDLTYTYLLWKAVLLNQGAHEMTLYKQVYIHYDHTCWCRHHDVTITARKWQNYTHNHLQYGHTNIIVLLLFILPQWFQDG